mmetsp:Transcript_35539/g.84144  ORF Transcript_35539/g.84144 Transcript_35539/m.84144 type:complete len:281 (+) Transcript_35539:418-1260(+)
MLLRMIATTPRSGSSTALRFRARRRRSSSSSSSPSSPPSLPSPWGAGSSSSSLDPNASRRGLSTTEPPSSISAVSASVSSPLSLRVSISRSPTCSSLVASSSNPERVLMRRRSAVASFCIVTAVRRRTSDCFECASSISSRSASLALPENFTLSSCFSSSIRLSLRSLIRFLFLSRTTVNSSVRSCRTPCSSNTNAASSCSMFSSPVMLITLLNPASSAAWNSSCFLAANAASFPAARDERLRWRLTSSSSESSRFIASSFSWILWTSRRRSFILASLLS